MDGLPTWIILCLTIIFAAIFVSILIFFIVRRFVHIDILKKHHDLAGFVIATLGTLYSVFLGFTIVNSQDRHGLIISRINQEAYLSADLYREATAFPEEVKVKIQNGIKAYLKSVIEDEWSLMREKKESPYTLKKLEELWKSYYNFKPETAEEKLWFSQTLKTLMKFNSARLDRIYTSWESLGLLSWLALICGGVVIISFLFFFGTENIRAQLLINSLFIGYFVFMIYVVYSLDNPFRRPQIITPKAYEIVYNYYSEIPGKFISPEQEGLIK